MNALELAEAAVSAAPAAEALAHVSRERSLMLRFARNRPTQATAVDDVTVELAVLIDGHVGRASTNSEDPETLRACAGRAQAAARAAAAAGPGTFPGFEAAEPARSHHGHDPETAVLDAAAGGEALAKAFAGAERHALEAHGVWTVAEDERGVATSAGGSALDRATDAYMKVICIGPDGRSGYASDMAVAAGALDPTGLTERAAGKAAAAGRAVELPPGAYPVVMESGAVGTLLEQLAQSALNGLLHAEGRGGLVDRIGEQVAAPSINLADSPFFPGTLPRAFDAEGTPKRPLQLIQDGIARAVAHDLRSGALAGTGSTGHALEPGGAPDGPLPTNLVLAGGGAADLDDLCTPVERGIYVTRFWYENVVRPRETLITAVTRDGTFLIENGAVTRPLRNMRLTDSVLDILERVEDLTAAQRLTGAADYYARRFATGVVAPALRAEAVRFTGTTG
jgi:predicted Zn-dependent protease